MSLIGSWNVWTGALNSTLPPLWQVCRLRGNCLSNGCLRAIARLRDLLLRRARHPHVEDAPVARFLGVLIHATEPIAHGAVAYRQNAR